MMVNRKRRTLPRPTDLELAILRVIWRQGPSSVREVLKGLNQTRSAKVGYTTALKMLQIMTEKGLVERNDSVRPQIYTARLPQERTQQQLLNDLLERAFEGSAAKLVMQALSMRKTSPEELAEIRALLEEIERSRQ